MSGGTERNGNRGSEFAHTPNPEFARQNEVLRSLNPFVETQLNLLTPVDKIWHPVDVLPNPKSDNYHKEVEDLREAARGTSDGLIVVLIGDMITEEGLPLFTTHLNRVEGIKDETGIDDTPWARWNRGWTAEEDRHGVTLHVYNHLAGRANMKAVERTQQNFLRNGFDLGTRGGPYMSVAYPSGQELATSISHGNVARIAKAQGNSHLYNICTPIESDEKRHGKFYRNVYGEIVRIDPNGATIAFNDLLQEGLTMPGALMTDRPEPPTGRTTALFDTFAQVAMHEGVYTPRDYVNIFESLAKDWDIEHLSVTGEAEIAQEQVMKRLRVADKYATRWENSTKPEGTVLDIPWVDNPITLSPKEKIPA